MKRILYSLFTVLCIVSLFLSSSLFIDAYTTPKWYGALFCGVALVLLFTGWLGFGNKGKKNISADILLTIVAVSCVLQALYGIAQYMGLVSSHSEFRVTGSFDNPAGFAACLAVGAPVSLKFLIREGWVRRLSIMASVIIALAVCLSGSRAGMISIAVVWGLLLSKKLLLSPKYKVMIAMAALVVLMVALYWLKKDSANGRLLVWQCSWEMIKDKPILGFGQDGFRENYMLYQANYFKQHPDSQFTVLADNINTPFNEYLRVMINYGLMGFGLLVTAIILLWKMYSRNRVASQYAALSLIGIAIFAIFSYPFDYPFVWLIVVLNCFIIFKNTGYRYLPYRMLSRITFLLLIPISIFGSLFYMRRMQAEMEWCRIAKLSLYGRFELLLPNYKKVYSVLNQNPYFLYNYSVMLNDTQQYTESLRMAKECEQHLASYDLQLLLANNYQQLNQYNKAIYYYEHASAMCPVRFTPLYELCHVYDKMGNKQKAVDVAQSILQKYVKIKSDDILIIKAEMKEFLSNSSCKI